MCAAISNLLLIAFCCVNTSSFRFSHHQPLNSVGNQQLLKCANIKCTASHTHLFADLDDTEKTGYFQLPQRDNQGDYPFPLLSRSYEDTYTELPEDLSIDDAMKKRLCRQLLFAFDNYQEPEIIQMSQKILKMPAQLKKLLQLTNRAEEIEAAAEEGGGFDEYLYDALRSTRSEIRMYGKDVDFFDDDGKDIRGTDKDGFHWPWERK